MSLLETLSYLAWIVSGLLLLLILVDAIKVSSEFDEELLTSTSEGEDKPVEKIKQEVDKR